MVIRPPEGLDPDDWIDKIGDENILKAIAKPDSYINFSINFYKGDKLEGAERKEYIILLARELKKIKDSIVRNDLIRIISSKLKLDEKDLLRTVKTQRIIESRFVVEAPNDQKDINFTSKIEKAQFELIKLMLNSENQIKDNVERSIPEELITVPILKDLQNYKKSEFVCRIIFNYRVF